MLLPDKIPDALKAGKYWCLSGRGGDKAPYRLDGHGANVNQLDTDFVDFDTALTAYNRGGYDGLALAVTDGLAIIDLDHVSENGMMTVEAQRIISQMGTYAEASQGGDGVHIVARMPAGFNYDRSKYHQNHDGKECYVGPCPKVITITGNRWNDLDVEMRPMQVMDFLKEFMTKPPAPDPTPAADMIPVDDDFIIDHLRRPGTHSGRLWAGDMRDYGDDPSRADYGLISAILFYTDDADQVERVFRRSGLVRPKDDRKQSGSTYLRCTIENARSSYSGDRYDPDYRSAPIDYNDAGWLDHPTTEAGGGESVNDQKTTKEAEAATPPAASEKAPPEVTPPKRVPLVPDDFSELGLAEWFVAKHGDDYRYNDSHGVLHYNEISGCWEEDSHAMQMEVIRDLDDLRSVAKLKKDNANYNMEHCVVVDPIEHDKELTKFGEDQAYAEELEKFVGKMRSANRIKGVCDLVIPHIVISSDKLDHDPYVLNTPDGLIDLRTGKISPHSRAAYCTKTTRTGPSDTGMDVWEEFIDTITVGDSSLAGFLQLVIGMCLIGTVKAEKTIFLIGKGANGKSTFTGAIMNVLGDYATAIDSEVLMNTRKNVMPAVAMLRGTRMALASELAENRRIDTGQLKKLSSTDLITAERKYFAPETFRPSHTLILQSNYLPRVDALDKGTWRRICAIPFFATIDANEAIENYAEVLFEKAGGAIMQWAIEGAVNFTRNNYKLDPIPEAVEKTTEEYKDSSNWIEIFLTECTDSDGDSPAHDVYQKYAQWALARGEHPRSETSFGTAMRAAGHGSEHARSGSVYYGIRVTMDD